MLAHFAVESVRDFFRVTFPIQKTSDRLRDDRVHLEAAVTFIERSIEQAGGRGSSKAYQVGKGWLPPYRETTGYIIPTLLDLAEHLDRPELAATAERMGEWLAQVQEPSGGFIEHDLRQDTKPIVFNTGQILQGFNALILRRGRKDLIPNARRAGDFIAASADATGSFVRNEHYDMAHAYNVRSAWALLTLGRLLGEKTYEDAALANADWTVAQQSDKGFFLNNVFQPGWNANTHGIAYVLQGLLEIHCISGREPYLAAVRRTAERIVSVYGPRRQLVSEIGENWKFLSSLPDRVRAAGDRVLQAPRPRRRQAIPQCRAQPARRRRRHAGRHVEGETSLRRHQGLAPHLRTLCPAPISELGNQVLHRRTARQARSAECLGSHSSSTIRWLTTLLGSRS